MLTFARSSNKIGFFSIWIVSIHNTYGVLYAIFIRKSHASREAIPTKIAKRNYMDDKPRV